MEDPWKKHRPGALKHCHTIGNNFPFCGGGGRGSSDTKALSLWPLINPHKLLQLCSFFFFPKIVLAMLGALQFQRNLRNSLSISTKKSAKFLIGIELNL